MTTFNKTTDIPPAIATLEQLLAWLILSLFNAYKALTYAELQNSLPEKVIDMSLVQAADGTTRLLFRGSLEMKPNYDTVVNEKLWLSAKEWGTVPLPAAYKVD